jgi:hypothetical protein
MKTAQADMADAHDLRPPRNNRGRWLAAGSSIAALILAVPIVFDGVGRAYQIAAAPEQIAAILKHQHEIDSRLDAEEASQREIRSGINRILSAMHLEPIKENKEKDNQP